MYLYQPCLLSMALYAWAFDDINKKGRFLRILAPVVILFLSEWELAFVRISVYPAALLLPFIYLTGENRTIGWAEVLTASIIGGLICWKIGDAWPLFWGTGSLCTILLLITVAILCREREDRFLACALGSLLFELFACLREYMLFSYCLIRLGSRETLSLGASSICLYFLFEQIIRAVRSRKEPVAVIGN